MDAEKWRFVANFGTAACETCTGLHAGPGVTATCFQVKRCTFGPVQAGPRNVLTSLLDD